MWQPLLDGSLALEAWSAVRAIADDLSTVEIVGPQAAEVALFRAYAAGALDDDTSATRLERAMDTLLEALDGGIPGVHLYGGLAGAGWVLAHVADESDELLDAIDRRLVRELAAAPQWDGHYDLVQGIT